MKLRLCRRMGVHSFGGEVFKATTQEEVEV
jgi:hypothetical protein